MKDYINLIDIHSNEFVNKRLNVLNKTVLSKDSNYIEKKRKIRRHVIVYINWVKQDYKRKIKRIYRFII